MKPRDVMVLGLALALVAYGWKNWPRLPPPLPSPVRASAALSPASPAAPPAPTPAAPTAATSPALPQRLEAPGARALDFGGGGVITADARGRVLLHRSDGCTSRSPPAPPSSRSTSRTAWRSAH